MSIYTKLNKARVNKSSFNMSHQKLLTCSIGELVPIFNQEVLPGDKWNVKMEQLIKFAPLATPVFQNLDVHTHFFFVPNRLLWNNWENFISGQQVDAKGNIIEPTHPYITPYTMFASGNIRGLFGKNCLGDYLGYPTPNAEFIEYASKIPEAKQFRMSPFPIAAYMKIYADYYADRDLNKVPPLTPDNDGKWYSLLETLWNIYPTGIIPANYERDYITSLRPFAQKGAAVMLNSATDPYISVNETREAFSIQRWLERTMQGGSRYIEQLKSHFGVTSSDARLQRAEYLGGAINNVMIGESLQTSSSDATSFQGNRVSVGNSYGNNFIFNREFDEHGILMGIMFVRPKQIYGDFVDRHLLKRTKFDYFWPEFENLGEQEVTTKEALTDVPKELMDVTYGYQQRYGEYRSIRSTCHGHFRDTMKTFLMKYEPTEYLNHVTNHVMNVNNIFALQEDNAENLWCQYAFDVIADRPMTYIAQPGMIDH